MPLRPPTTPEQRRGRAKLGQVCAGHRGGVITANWIGIPSLTSATHHPIRYPHRPGAGRILMQEGSEELGAGHEDAVGQQEVTEECLCWAGLGMGRNFRSRHSTAIRAVGAHPPPKYGTSKGINAQPLLQCSPPRPRALPANFLHGPIQPLMRSGHSDLLMTQRKVVSSDSTCWVMSTGIWPHSFQQEF